MSELGEFREAIGEVRKDIKEILQVQATTAATLEVISKESKAQIGVLFSRRDRDIERIQRIELDYTPRNDHRKLEQQVERIDRQVAKWIGALALLQVVLSIAGAWIVKAVVG